MSREKATRGIEDPRIVNAWHVAGDRRSTSERPLTSDPLKDLCAEVEFKNRIRVAKIQNENPNSDHRLPLIDRFYRRNWRGD